MRKNDSIVFPCNSRKYRPCFTRFFSNVPLIIIMSIHDTKNSRNGFILRVFAVLFWSSGLVILSLMPSSYGPNYFSGQDKLFHFFAYLLMAWLAGRSLIIFSVSTIKSVIISLTYCSFLGALLELLQHTLTRSRTAELNDILANLAGAVTGCAIFCLQQKLSSTNNANR